MLAEVWSLADNGERGGGGAPVFINMRHFLFPSCLLASLGLAQAAETSALHFYAEPSAVYAHFPGGNIKDGLGASLAVGAIFRQVHSVQLEVAYFKTDTDYPLTTLAFTPVLLKYRYALPMSSGWSGYVGVAGGAVFERDRTVYRAFSGVTVSTPDIRNLPLTGPLATYTFEERDTAAAFGAEIGLSRQLGERASVGLSLTSLYLGDTQVATDGTVLLLNLRLGYRF